MMLRSLLGSVGGRGGCPLGSVGGRGAFLLRRGEPVGGGRRAQLLRSCSILHSPTMGREDYFGRVLDSFPQQRSLVLAYGSGVFQQEGQAEVRNNMTDFIFCVDNSLEWHRENMSVHPSHYASFARVLGASRVSSIQRQYGARLYFNTLVPWGEGQIKYGVIDREDLLNDLLDWETLYTAGRLHKPVNILEKKETDGELEEALRTNINSALHAALLLLPAQFSEEKLYLTLAGLSYTGDFRMVVGEDKNKVSNIVKPQLERFKDLYKNRVLACKEFLEVEKGECVQDCSRKARLHHCTRLPLSVTDNLVINWNKKFQKTRDVETVCLSIAADPDCDHRVSDAVSGLVAATDKTQAAKGILTAGPRKAARYALAKLKKMLKSQGVL